MSRSLVGADGERQSLLFVPQAVFDQIALGELPLDAQSSIRLRLDVQRFPEQYRRQFSGGLPPECWPAGSRPSQGSHPAATDLASLLKEGREVYVGKVIEVVSGWDFHRNQIGQKVTVLVEERLHSEEEVGPQASQEIFLLLQGGKLRIDETELCDTSSPAEYRPRIGDRLVLSGHRYSTKPAYFQGLIFPVEEGQVLPQPYAQLREDQEPVSLSVLEQVLSAHAPDLEDLP